jgi:XTP/dITP diphosphohydrolase
MTEIIFATGNQGKLQEVQNLLSEEFKILGLKDIHFFEDIPETAETIEGNARLKAEFIYQKFKKNCFADDTGLEVEALNGRPGVYSARYAGDDNNAEANMDKLLDELKGLSNRAARFKTVIVLCFGGKYYEFEGIVNGTITHKRRGGKGFGYDPIFIPEGCDKSFAEMSIEEKNQISHRAIAVKKLAQFLNEQLS